MSEAIKYALANFAATACAYGLLKYFGAMSYPSAFMTGAYIGAVIGGAVFLYGMRSR